jgi:hypothetical protein
VAIPNLLAGLVFLVLAAIGIKIVLRLAGASLPRCIASTRTSSD